jgi:hypothetical protein
MLKEFLKKVANLIIILIGQQKSIEFGLSKDSQKLCQIKYRNISKRYQSNEHYFKNR